MISFENTEIAFAYKSDKDLKRAYRLFQLVGLPWLVSFGKKFTPLAFRLRLPIKGLIKATIFRQFCGGESIEDCNETIATLVKHGVGTILDYSVEGKTEDEGFEETCNEIIATINKSANDSAIPFAVFKVTGIARFGLLEKMNDTENLLTEKERREYQLLFQRLDKICLSAYNAKTPVFIDAEESWIQNSIDRLAIAMMQKYNKEEVVVFNTLQMYRHDRLEYLYVLHKKSQQTGFKVGVKLVRGAYMEKERERALKNNYSSPIQPDKRSCDLDFNKALNYIIENIADFALCNGTHNEESSLLLTKLIAKHGINPKDKRVYFAQLLGMSDHISFNLAAGGYNVAKYVPYGPVKEVMPYLLRRADENTSVAGQTGRELSLLRKEYSRRKKNK
ncbi:MAG: proline dehydrogenase family protein [Crocinitomicaceae bacterium]|nr:proline dehydrogenase family protein [Crocinitomicaceae bacterium]